MGAMGSMAGHRGGKQFGQLNILLYVVYYNLKIKQNFVNLLKDTLNFKFVPASFIKSLLSFNNQVG